MNILIISSPDPYKVSGTVALDLYKELSSVEEYNVKLLTKFCSTKDHHIVSMMSGWEFYLDKIVNKIKRSLQRMGIFKTASINSKPEFHMQSLNDDTVGYETSSLLKKVKMNPDKIIILFFYGMLSFKNIKELCKITKATVFLYPMDMAPFTGGCHYAWNCEGYKNGCGSCPAIFSNDQNDITYINLLNKKNNLRETKLKLLACNSQIYDQIKASNLFKDNEVINGIYPVPDKTIFFKKDKKKIRKNLNLEMNQIVFFFGAVSLADKRKGMHILLDAIRLLFQKCIHLKIEKENIVFLVAGANAVECEKQIPFKVINLGFTKKYNLLADLYNAADYFISPSIEETGPTMVLQSVLCETPVVSFELGYAKDLFHSELLELVAKNKTANDLSSCLLNAIQMNSEKKSKIFSEIRAIKNILDYKEIGKKLNKAFYEN